MAGHRSIGCIPPGEPQFVSISLSSGFSFQVRCSSSGLSAFSMFPSRYRAASHFRLAILIAPARTDACFNLVIERLLISGSSASFTVVTALSFQSRYRAASHFRSAGAANRTCRLRSSFNLVIERLLISGERRGAVDTSRQSMFQSRYRAASHFR